MKETKNMLLSRMEAQLVILESKERQLKQAQQRLDETASALVRDHGMKLREIPGFERVAKLT